MTLLRMQATSSATPATGAVITGHNRRRARIHDYPVRLEVRITSFTINEMQDHFIVAKFSPRLAIERKLAFAEGVDRK